MIETPTLFAIVAMALATYATRVAGLFIAGWIPDTGRARSALDALPPAVLTAVIAPTAIATGWPETLATAAAVASAAARLPMIVTVLIGVAAAAGLRALAG